MRNKWHYFLCLLAVLAIGFTCSSAYAFSTLDLGNGQELSIMGYVTQSVNYGLHEDFNQQHGFNGLLTNVFAEANYKFSKTAKFYISGMFTADWIYDARTAGSWVQKEFDKSRVHGNKLYMDNEYWQLLKEAYVDFNPGNFLFRFGKQAVVWGEMDGFRLMDQINPMDSRRALSVVEIETSLIPIWMARFEYNPQFYTSWLTDMNLQFVFNPNVTFIPNLTASTGNNIGGISAPQVNAGTTHIGETTMLLDRPKDLDSDGFAYAFRASANILGGRASLNYYYGRDHTPVTVSTGFMGFGFYPAYDGSTIMTTTMRGFYPLFRFVGATYSRDVPFMRSNFLGGVAPTFRLESIYAFNNTFSATNPLNPFDFGHFVHSDEFRFGLGVDWKVKIPLLNKNAYFSISPQYYYRRIMNYPSVDELSGLNQVNEMATLMISTSYLNAKLTPTLFWMHNISDKADMINLSVGYQYSDVWQHSVGTFIFGGPKGSSFSMFDKKDYVYYKINYKF